MSDTQDLEEQLSVRSDDVSRDAVAALRKQREEIGRLNVAWKERGVTILEAWDAAQCLQVRIAELDKLNETHTNVIIKQRVKINAIESAESEQCRLVAQDLEVAQARVEKQDAQIAESLKSSNEKNGRIVVLQNQVEILRAKLGWLRSRSSQRRVSNSECLEKAQMRVEELEAEYSHAAQTLRNRCEACDAAERRLRDVVKLGKIARENTPEIVWMRIDDVMAAAGFERCRCMYDDNAVQPKDCPCTTTDTPGWVEMNDAH